MYSLQCEFKSASRRLGGRFGKEEKRADFLGKEALMVPPKEEGSE